MSPPRIQGLIDEEEEERRYDVTKTKKTKSLFKKRTVGSGGKLNAVDKDAEDVTTLPVGVQRSAISQKGSKGLSASSNKSSRSQTPSAPTISTPTNTSSLSYLEKLQSAQRAARQTLEGQVDRSAVTEEFISLDTGEAANHAFYSGTPESRAAEEIIDLDGKDVKQQAGVESAAEYFAMDLDRDGDDDDDEDSRAWEYDLISKGTAQNISDSVLRNELSEVRIPGHYSQALPALEGSIQRLESQLANTILKKTETQAELDGYRESKRILDEKKEFLKEALRKSTEDYVLAESQLTASRG